MYFPDLSGYRYSMHSFEGCADKHLEGVFNVGWLDKAQPHQRGPAGVKILDKLQKIVRRFRVNVYRGWHECNLCKESALVLLESGGKPMYLGDAELWIPGERGVIYACPNLIYHYISRHGYLPPQAFLASVERFDLKTTLDFNALHDQLLNKILAEVEG